MQLYKELEDKEKKLVRIGREFKKLHAGSIE